jgi:hypothetical protein
MSNNVCLDQGHKAVGDQKLNDDTEIKVQNFESLSEIQGNLTVYYRDFLWTLLIKIFWV